MTTLYLLHGWGYDSRFWDPLLALLSEALPGMTALRADAGYHGHPASPPLPGGPFWAVGHSAGACALLALEAPHCLGLLSINGFARFTRSWDFPEGVPERVLARMVRQLARQPREVLMQFRRMCGEDRPDLPALPDSKRLEAGLDALRMMDHRPLLPRWSGRLHSLHSPDDPLPPARTGPEGGGAGTSLPGGHLLPLTHPQDCAAWLARIINHSGPS